MTYCLGWKSDSAVYLIADSVVESDETPRLSKSSFGEKHASLEGRLSGRHVQEATLKLFDLGPCAVTFSGSVTAGRRMIKQMESEIAKGRDSQTAFANATRDDNLMRHVKAMMVHAVKNAPQLAVYNENEDGTIRWDADLGQIGSIKDAFQELTTKCLEGIRFTPEIPQRHLVQALALVQSYGIHTYLLEDGVGGSYCGLYLDQSGIHWQPDTLYVVADPCFEAIGLVGSFARRNVFCLFSSLCEAGKIVFASPEHNESGELFRQRFTDVERAVEQKHEEAIFDYVTIFNTSKHIAVTVELLGQQEHELLKVETHPSTPRTTGVFWSPLLQSRLDTIIEPTDYDGEPHDLCLQFFPYRPLRRGFSEEELAELRRLGIQPKER
ncbi:hypothetical protein [Neorhodopirellula lusitana]|uniref:hypothetical protein n=1 Tax=Neorhodopirellula lusitana TaxID=445327 RepID=UPI003850E5D4